MRIGREVLIGEVEFNLGNVSVLVGSSTREVLTCLRMASPSGWSLSTVVAGGAVTVSLLIWCVGVVRDCTGAVKSLSVLSKIEAEWENHEESKQVC
jgi:hypothetical protein